MMLELGYESELGRVVGYENLKKLKRDHFMRMNKNQHKNYRTAFGYCGVEDVNEHSSAAIIATYMHDRKFLILRTLLTALADVEAVRWHLPQGGVPYIVNLSLVGHPSETVVNYLSDRGIYVSAGSACAKGNRSSVLKAMDLPAAEIDSSLRISFCFENTEDEVRELASALREAAVALQRRRA